MMRGQVLRIRVEDFGLRDKGRGLWVEGLGWWLSGFGFRVLGFGFRVPAFWWGSGSTSPAQSSHAFAVRTKQWNRRGILIPTHQPYTIYNNQSPIINDQ